MPDGLSRMYASLVDGTYDCVDRIVLNAYFRFAQSPAGFRVWWRQLYGSDNDLDDAHLMRMAGRFREKLDSWLDSIRVLWPECPAKITPDSTGHMVDHGCAVLANERIPA